MDLVALIVTALAADRDSTVQDETRDAVRSAHKRLREAVRTRLAGHPGGDLPLARYEADPQAGRALLERELARAGAGDDADLVADALALIELAGRGGKHAVSISGSPGVMIGDNNVQVSYFAQDPAGQRGTGPAAVVAGPDRAAAATRELALPDHARARKDADRFSGDAPRDRQLRTRAGDKVAQEMEALGPDQAALTIEYARHPGYAKKLTVGLTRMAPEAAAAALCRVHARQVPDWLRYMHPLDPERTVRVMELIGPRRLAAMMSDRSPAEVDELLARVPGALAAAIRAELTG